MRKFRALCLLGLTLLFGGAAAGQTVTSTYDKDYGLSKLDTYEFSSVERDKSDPLATNTLTEGKIKDALDEELQNSGHHPPPHGAAPSFLVSFHVKAEDKVEEYGGKTSYVQGVLIVDFHDAATKKLVWRGRASGTVELKGNDKKIDKAVDKLVKQLLKDAKKGE